VRFQYSATVVHAGPSFRLVDYRCPVAEANRLLPETMFSAPTIVFPRRGVFFSHQGSRALLGDANHVLFFDAGDPFRIRYPIEGGDDSTFLSISREALAGILGGPGERIDPLEARFPASIGEGNARLYLAHRTLLEGIGCGVLSDSLAVEERMIELAGAAIAASRRIEAGKRAPARRETQRAHRETVAAVAALLAGAPPGRIGIDDLAKAVGASPFHLCRVFKRETGVSIHRYGNRLRLRAALDRLMEPAADLTALALDSGFSSHSHFTDAFRREFGAAPSHVRRTATRALLAKMRRLVA
jgi:AraC-like DNA-binding protein